MEIFLAICILSIVLFCKNVNKIFIIVLNSCKCNGHAYRCIDKQNEYGETRKVCDCQHNTDGVDCEKCLPFYQDQPWGKATSNQVNECKG